MPIPFQELAGSPTELYTFEGFRARREFLIAWQDRDAFAAEVLGTATEYGGGGSVHYPGKPSVYAVRLRYVPLDPDAPEIQQLGDLTVGLNSYGDSFAKAIVEYRTIVERDRDDGPANEVGTHLTYRMGFSEQSVRLTADGWQWEDQPAIPLPADLDLNRTIPLTEHRLAWHQVIHPPWTAIHAMQGRLNGSEFLGCPAETLLFAGAEAHKLFRAGLEEGPSPFAWRIAYTFRERSVKHGGSVYGWNHVYRGDPAGWVRLTNGSDLLYDTADFNGLFVSGG
jgi:hypothetical protein